MKQDEFFKIVGIIIVSFFIIYMVIKMFQLQTNVIEGLTTGSDNVATTNVSSGEAGTAASYAAAIKAQVIKLQDELLIAKYRKDYESVIINLDDYVGYLMLKASLNLKLEDDVNKTAQNLNIINLLKNTKDSLNTTMTFLDKQ
jgi:hypothetical protein